LDTASMRIEKTGQSKSVVSGYAFTDLVNPNGASQLTDMIFVRYIL